MFSPYQVIIRVSLIFNEQTNFCSAYLGNTEFPQAESPTLSMGALVVRDTWYLQLKG